MYLNSPGGAVTAGKCVKFPVLLIFLFKISLVLIFLMEILVSLGLQRFFLIDEEKLCNFNVVYLSLS